MKIIETREHAKRRIDGILEVCKKLQQIPSTKLFEAVENYSVLNEEGELGEILNKVLDDVKEEHPELVTTPNADDKAAVASSKTDQELFYGEYKLKLNLSSLSDGYIEIVVSKNGIETIKAEDEPKEKEEEKKEDAKQEQPEQQTATSEENKTAEGDQTGNNPPAPEEKKESKNSDRKPINEDVKRRLLDIKRKRVNESVKSDNMWDVIKKNFDLGVLAVALITEDEVIFIDDTILDEFYGKDSLVDVDSYSVDMNEVIKAVGIKSALDVRSLKQSETNKSVYSFDNEHGEWNFEECSYNDIIKCF